MKKLLYLLLLFSLSNCRQNGYLDQPIPKNYEEMFSALKLKAEVPYTYTEIINNSPTGKTGTIVFSLTDTTMTENFNLTTTREKFQLENFGAYSCNFINPGLDLHPINTSVFINKAQQTISYVNGRTFISFSFFDRGTYYFSQFVLSQ